MMDVGVRQGGRTHPRANTSTVDGEEVTNKKDVKQSKMSPVAEMPFMTNGGSPLSCLVLDSVQWKRLWFKGTFSFSTGDYNACICVDFGVEPLPINVWKKCNLHSSTVFDSGCPCTCMLRMDEAIRNQKLNWWPPDCGYLYPPSYQFEAVKNAVLSCPSLTLSLPLFQNDCNFVPVKSSPAEILEASPKFKDKMSGPRHRSNGELNSSA